MKKTIDKKEFIDRIEFAMIAFFNGDVATEVVASKYICDLVLHPNAGRNFLFDINALWNIYTNTNTSIDMIIMGMQKYIEEQNGKTELMPK